MLVPNRNYSSPEYRYGFNGKEKDDEVKGSGMQLDYGFRIYDPRLGKFLSEDPLFKNYAYYTPYQFAGNRPINSIDLDGLEEYSSYEAYKLYQENCALDENMLDGNDGVWFTQDRIDKNNRWKNAMEYITKTEDTDKLTQGTVGVYDGKNTIGSYSFKQVRDYYIWAQDGMDKKGFGSRWAKGATYLVDELADTYEATDGATGSIQSGGFMPKLGGMLKELNIGIADYAIGRFNSVLYGSEGETVCDWYEWDVDFIWDEQVTVAAPTYDKFSGTTTLSSMNDLARKEGLLGNLAISKHFFPNFALFDIDLTDKKSKHGAMGRFNVPLHMLYPKKHQEKSNKKLSEKQQKEINRANNEINTNYEKNKIKK